jgi:hypothetical protein
MKRMIFFIVLAFICLAFCVKPREVLSQHLTDSTVNFYTLSAYYDHYYDSLIQRRGAGNIRGTGYTDYLRWKWFYTSRHGVDGDLGAMWQSMAVYYNNLQEPENYTDESYWKFIGPNGIPLKHNGEPSQATGKGMMLSLWVSGGDHSLIYAGSHHGGLWKTTDGGESWSPLNDNDNRIHGVNSLAVDPTNTDVLYISCGSAIGSLLGYSEGLFKSSDGGLSWNQLVLPVNYPVSDWKLEERKVVLHPNYPDNIFYLTYRDAFRSTDQGNNWTNVFHKDYSRWGEDPQKGFFDFKILPWDQNVAYLAGSEIFKIEDPLVGFNATEISDEVFFSGLNPEDFIAYIPDRTEISVQENFPNKIWFCYYAQYIPIEGESYYKFRVVKYDASLQLYQVVFEDSENYKNPGINEFKLEFSVSPSRENTFYFGGIGITCYNPNIFNDFYNDLNGGAYPENCWVHDDIRDMQIFSNGNGNDTLYIADDSGISWGTRFESEPNDCSSSNDDAWHWRHPCESEEFGLNVTEFYGIGAGEAPSLIAGGCQDLSIMLKDGDEWINFGSGDGSEIIFAPDNPNIIYYSEWQGGSLLRTKNKGESFVPLFSFNYSHEIIPMVLDPYDPGILYSGNKTLLKFNGVNDFTLPGPFVPVEMQTFNDPITAIKVMKLGNNRRYFVSTKKAYNESVTPSSAFENCIYYWEEGGQLNDISATLDACRYGFISEIEVNPENPDQIWVCASLYSTGMQDSKVCTLTLPEQEWVDYSQGLPAGLPVIKIKFLPFTNRLYAATDVGVFIRDIGDPQWYPYNTNLPKKIITDIDFNLPFKKIYAATFGRGLWETDFEGICDHNTPLYITGHETWTVDHVAQGDIKIGSGGILEIDHCKLYMPENARISVAPGGVLLVDGGIITSACPSPWGGIEVWGSNYYQGFPDYFGQVYLINHAVIKNARVAISNYGAEEVLQIGGIIYAIDAIFSNNQIAVNYRQFKNMYHGQEYPYHSIFTRCKFEFDQNKLPDLNFEYFIKMDRVNGIRFYGCDFTNSIDLTASQGELQEKYGTGIYSFGSQFYVDQTCLNRQTPPCTEYKQSTFTGLNYGIYAMGIDALRTISVNKSIFKDNVTGVFLSGIENATVTLNDFHVNQKYISPPVPYDTYVGLYLDGCTGFTVEENYFDQEADYDFHNTGIVVKDAGPNYNEIYNNFFTKRFEAGITALNKNKGNDIQSGLQIKCNEFDELGPFTSDILVFENGTLTTNSGIAQNQGSGEAESSPAGNLFSRYSLDSWKDYVNQVDNTRIDYYMNYPQDEIRVEPRWYTNNIILHNTNITFDKERSCKSHLTKPDPNPDPPHLRAELELYALKIDSVQTELSTWVDGGNTDQLVSDVTFSTPPEAYDLYSDLILKSPYLSDTVLKESIQKEDVLDNVMIEDILVANPQSAKSAEIQESLDEKNNLLTDDQRGNIDQGNYFLSGKEILESRLAWNNHCRAMIIDDLISLFKNDTVNAYSIDSLKTLLNDENDPGLLYQLAYIWLNEGDSVESWNILNNLDDSFNFNPAQLELHQQYIDYAKQYSEISNSDNPAFPFDSISRSILYALKEQQTFPGIYSRNVLQFFDTLLYVEPYIIPTETEKTGVIPTNHKVTQNESDDNFRIYPNPSMSYFITEFSIQKSKGESLELFISDISGCILQQIPLTGSPGHKIISTKDFKPGLYLCKFVLNGKERQVIKLSVVK